MLIEVVETSASSAALVAGPAARVIQDSDDRLSVLVRSCPGYLADDCQLVTDARARLLRSADTRTLAVHRTEHPAASWTGPVLAAAS